MTLCYRSDFLSFFGHALKTTLRLQLYFWGYKIWYIIPKSSIRHFDNTQVPNLYKKFFIVNDNDDDL